MSEDHREEYANAQMPDDKVVEYLSSVQDANDVSEFLSDPEVDQTLAHVIRLIAKPDTPAEFARPLIVKLQAMSFMFKVRGKKYMIMDKTKPEARDKKNFYLSLAEETDKLVAALKYITHRV